MTEQEILAALEENDLNTIRAIREKDDALMLQHEMEAESLRQQLYEVRNAAAN